MATIGALMHDLLANYPLKDHAHAAISVRWQPRLRLPGRFPDAAASGGMPSLLHEARALRGLCVNLVSGEVRAIHR